MHILQSTQSQGILADRVVLSILTLLVLSFLVFYQPVQAQSAAELQEKIDQRSRDIRDLEKEIAAYQTEINALNGQASSLSATIRSLELTQKKLEADISVTQNKIAAKNLEIQRLSGQIRDKDENITDNRRLISRSFSVMRELEDLSLPEILLGSPSLSDAWNSLDELVLVQDGLNERIAELRNLRTDLENNKRASEKARAELVSLNQQLNDQKKVTQATAADKSRLLKETKQSEAGYQLLLAERKKLRDAFEREMREFESQLSASVAAGALPRPGTGILSWPLAKIYVTQYFGNTPFATANPQIYSGQGHNGIDLRASIGTPVRSALSGVVLGTGNTDAACPYVSYGKWVLIKHSNGLTTLYAHLSVISSSKGDVVKTGDTIGYSGSTGFSTGPHLHFTVYASDGVSINTYNFRSCAGKRVEMPSITKNGAYLNPLSYLPAP